MRTSATFVAARWAAANVAVLALFGCSIGDLDLTGRQCPCTDGYVCDSASNTCVESASTSPTGGSGGGVGGSGAGGGSTGGQSAAGGAGGADGGAGGSWTLVFSDEFDGDMSQWSTFGEGTWVVEQGEMRETDPEVEATFVWAPAIEDLSGYRAVTRMRQIEGIAGGAMEVVALVDVSEPRYFYCNYEPNDGYFLWMGTTAEQPIGYTLESMVVDTFAIPDYDPMAWFTTVVEVRDGAVHCHIEEIPEATLTIYDATLPVSGSAGMKVWMMATAYDYFRVYQPAD